MIMKTSVAEGEKQTPSGTMKNSHTRKAWRLICSSHRIRGEYCHERGITLTAYASPEIDQVRRAL